MRPRAKKLNDYLSERDYAPRIQPLHSAKARWGPNTLGESLRHVMPRFQPMLDYTVGIPQPPD